MQIGIDTNLQMKNFSEKKDTTTRLWVPYLIPHPPCLKPLQNPLYCIPIDAEFYESYGHMVVQVTGGSQESPKAKYEDDSI